MASISGMSHMKNTIGIRRLSFLPLSVCVNIAQLLNRWILPSLDCRSEADSFLCNGRLDQNLHYIIQSTAHGLNLAEVAVRSQYLSSFDDHLHPLGFVRKRSTM